MFSGGHWKTTTNPNKVTVKTSDGSTGDLDSTSTDWECNYETKTLNGDGFKSSDTSTLIVSKTLTYRKLFAGLAVCKNGIAGAQMHVGHHTEKSTLKFTKKGSTTSEV